MSAILLCFSLHLVLDIIEKFKDIKPFHLPHVLYVSITNIEYQVIPVFILFANSINYEGVLFPFTSFCEILWEACLKAVVQAGTTVTAS